MIAISPQSREHNAEVSKQHRLAFPVLTDAGNTYARQLSLPHQLPEDLREIYAAFGIVLPQFNGDESWELPIAARLVIGRDGVIRSIEADADYTRRPEPEATIEVLRSL